MWKGFTPLKTGRCLVMARSLLKQFIRQYRRVLRSTKKTLAWVSVEEASQFYASAIKQLQQQREENLKREAWKLHPLYAESRPTLVAKLTEPCLNPNGKKYELVKQIVESSEEAENFVNMLSETEL